MTFPEDVDLVPEEFAFEGLSHQNLTFERAVAELIDNAIGHSGIPFLVEISIKRLENGQYKTVVADYGTGIPLDTLKTRALKLGGRPVSESRLNEHGFGMKNSLCALTKNKLPFTVLTRDEELLGKDYVLKVNGPFKSGMQIVKSTLAELGKWRTGDDDKTGTVVIANCSLETLQTVARGVRGRRPTELETIMEYLAEHLGVFYRGYLEFDEDIGSTTGRIVIRYRENSEWEDMSVKQVKIPYGKFEEHHITLEIDGKSQDITYREGVRDESKVTTSIYYQGNIPTQGVDVQMNDRVVGPHWFDEIWDLARHNSYNDFVGEIVIRTDDRDRFTTLFNKTAFDATDSWWLALTGELDANHRPPRGTSEWSEAKVREKLANILEKTAGSPVVRQKYKVWRGVGVEIDIYEEDKGGDTRIYEMKVVQAQPLHVYQLRMYWDGLVADGKEPDEGTLAALEIPDSVRTLISEVNKQTDAAGENYNLLVKTLSEMQLT